MTDLDLAPIKDRLAKAHTEGGKAEMKARVIALLEVAG